MQQFFKSIVRPVLVTVSTVMMSCNPLDEESSDIPSEDCAPSGGKIVELTTSLSGTTHTVGETITISWKTDRNQITNGQVVVDVSIDNGITWSAIPDAGIPVPSGNHYQCMSLNWKIGDEGEAVDYESENGQCMIRIHEYSNTSNGVVFSDHKFTIRK